MNNYETQTGVGANNASGFLKKVIDLKNSPKSIIIICLCAAVILAACILIFGKKSAEFSKEDRVAIEYAAYEFGRSNIGKFDQTPETVSLQRIDEQTLNEYQRYFSNAIDDGAEIVFRVVTNHGEKWEIHCELVKAGGKWTAVGGGSRRL